MLRRAAFCLLCLFATPVLADWDRARLDREIAALEQRSQGRLGVALLDLRDRELWSHRGAESFPMQSVFKLPLAIAVLQAVESGRLKLDQPITIHRREFSLYHSPLAKAFKGESNAYPVRELIRLAAGESDNTAADILMREIGGPKTVTAMLKAGDIAGISVDRYEREFQPEIYGLPGFAWSEAIDEPAYRARLAKLDPQRRQRALAAALKDKRDSSTPEASVLFLEAQAKGNWLRDPAHSRLIDRVATESPTGPKRIKAGLPPGARFAHKTGLGLTLDGINHATNDIGVVRLPDGRAFAIAVYLAGSRADEATREVTHAAMARLAVAALK